MTRTEIGKQVQLTVEDVIRLRMMEETFEDGSDEKCQSDEKSVKTPESLWNQESAGVELMGNGDVVEGSDIGSEVSWPNDSIPILSAIDYSKSKMKGELL